MSRKLPPEEKLRRKRAGNARWYKNTREVRLAKAAALRAIPEYREKMCRYLARYYKQHREARCQHSIEYQRIDRKTNPTRRLKDSLRSSMRSALIRGGTKKSESAINLLGCTAAQFRAHIEKQFLPGMTWQNYGHASWHLDHIKPCAAFNLHNPAERKACFHFTNFQPLWAKDNHSKGSRWKGEYIRPNRSRSIKPDK